MAVIWVLVAACAAFFLYGLLVPTPYLRRFPAGLPVDETVDGYLKPREVEDPDEPEMFVRVSEAFAGDTLRRRKNAGREDAAFYEPHWGHTTGMLRGRLEITDIDALPELFRVGLFEKQATYPLVARSDFTRDDDIKFAVNRLAIKLETPEPVPNVYAPEGTAQELDLLLVEGSLNKNAEGHWFFIRDGRQFDLAATLKPFGLKTIKAFLHWRNIGLLLGILGNTSKLMKPTRTGPSAASGWAGKAYYSFGPFALGPGVMKFRLMPQQAHPMPKLDVMKEEPTRPHAQAFEDWRSKGEDAVFDLAIQLARPEAIRAPGSGEPPKAVMAAEYCDLPWDEDHAPFVSVGRVVFSASDVPDPKLAWGLQFNAWNVPDVMRPLGQAFRMRRHVHAAHSEARVAHLHGETPGAMTGKCPFH